MKFLIQKLIFKILKMGGQNSKQTKGQSPVQIDHPKFQNAKVIEQKGQVFMITSMGIEQKDYIKWNTIISSLKADPEYLLLPKKHDFSTKGLCGSSGTLNTSYEYYPYLLIEEIENRKRRKSKFQQCQLWFLLYSLSAAQNQMKKFFNSKVGDIRPQNIFISQQGQIKVSCLNSFPNEGSNFQKTFDHQETLLAPEEMNKLELGGMDDINNFQSEMFSIGMTILSAALLTDFSNVYDIKKFKFNYDAATDYLEQWKANDTYSQIFTAFISNLCSFDATNRLNQRQLWSWISKYDRYIQEKEDFVIDHAPIKIQKQIQQNRNQSSIKMLNQGKVEHSIVNHGNIAFQQRSTVYPFMQGQRVVSPVIAVPAHMVPGGYTFPVNPLISPRQGHTNIQTAQSMYTQIPPQIYQKQFGHVVQPGRVSTGFQGYQGYQPRNDYGQANIGHNTVNMVHNGTNMVQNGTNMVQNGGTFVYTRRIIDPNSNKVIAQERIGQGQYHQGLTGSDKEVNHLQ